LAAADPDITTADVKLTTITAEATGDGVAVSFQVQAKDASPKQLEDAIVSASMANRINTELHAAGFHDAEAHGRADIVDLSPTGAPSSMPTQVLFGLFGPHPSSPSSIFTSSLCSILIASAAFPPLSVCVCVNPPRPS